MKNLILVCILFSVVNPLKISGQEIAVKFLTESQSHSELLEVPKTIESFSSREVLLTVIDEEIKRLQLKGYISTLVRERAIFDKQGFPILEIVFDLGQQ
ncbi:MAG: hypothetical protein RIQ82_605, partial [Bacteroidota bacterium]